MHKLPRNSRPDGADHRQIGQATSTGTTADTRTGIVGALEVGSKGHKALTLVRILEVAKNIYSCATRPALPNMPPPRKVFTLMMNIQALSLSWNTAMATSGHHGLTRRPSSTKPN